MVRRGILLGHCAEQSKALGPHHQGGGGTLQARPGPRLRSRLARTPPRGGRAPWSLAWPRRAGPNARGGGGDVLASPGLRAWLSAPRPPRPYRARRRPPRPVLPLHVHAAGLAAPWPRPAALPPPSPRLCPGGGGGRPAGPPRGREGGGLAASRPAAGPSPRRGRPVLHVTHPHPRPRPAPRCPRWSLPPRRWSSEALAVAQTGSRAGTSRCIRFVSHAVRGAVCGRRRPPLEEADGVSWCPLRLG